MPDIETLKREMDEAAREFAAAEDELRRLQFIWTHTPTEEHPAQEGPLREAEVRHRDARDKHAAACAAFTNRR